MTLPDPVRRALGDLVLDDVGTRDRYARDASPFRVVPEAVAVARGEEDVVAVVEACAEGGVPVTARSGGTGLAGQSIGEGLVLDVGSLPEWVRPGGDGTTVSASASATVDAVNARLRPLGRRLGPDLTSSGRARIAGMIATNACGAGSRWFGRVADGVRSVEFVDGTGVRRRLEAPDDENQTARPGRVERGAAGFAGSGARALCGSEGTLGIVLSATLRTYEVRPAAVGVLAFGDVRRAADAVPAILEHGPYAVELMDRLALRGRWPDDPAAILVVEMHAATAPEAEERFWDLRIQGAMVDTGLDASAREAAWRLRRSVLAELLPEDGRRPVALIEDAGVPVERLPELVVGLEAVARRLDVEMVFYGHAAAGTLHVRPLLDLRREEHRRAAVALIGDHADLVLSLGGSLSSEHGLGLARTWLVEREFPAATVEGWRRLKAELDPAGILNPGRVIPDRETFPAELLAY